MAPTLLWIDDAPDQVEGLAEKLRDAGFAVVLATTPTEGAALLAETPYNFLAVIVDLLMNIDTIQVPGRSGPELLDTRHGLNAGVVFGRWARQQWPDLNLIGVSTKEDPHDPQVEWFKTVGTAYFDKYTLYLSIRPLLLLLDRLLGEGRTRPTLKTVVVPDGNEAAARELLHYLKKTLRLPEPLLLGGSAEEVAKRLDSLARTPNLALLAFVLHSSADQPLPAEVLLVTGFLAAHCLPERGTVLLLHKGTLPSPIFLPGLAAIDIGAGLDAAGEAILGRISPYLPLLRRG